MAWTSPMTFVDGSALTASQLNTHLRDNLLASSVAKATTIPQYFVSHGANRVDGMRPTAARVDTPETTNSTDYTDLATNGPQVTITTDISAIVMLNAKIYDTALANSSHGMAFAVSGATDRDPDDHDQVLMDGVTANSGLKFSNFTLITDLTAGQNTFTCKYKAGSGTGSFANRLIVVLPL